jgi:tRNA G18 (ribose-2'-O)-methylase SpoU
MPGCGVVLVAIDDLGDSRLADYQHLREPSMRMTLERSQGIFTVEGRLSLEALVASPYEIRSVLVTAPRLERIAAMVGDDVPIYSLPARVIEEVTGVHFHRGVLAVAERPVLPTVERVVQGARRVLVLEGVNDHENIGSLFRNAAAFGVDAVVLDAGSADPLYRRATRVSLGHVLRIPFARAERDAWPSTLHDLRAAGIVTVALTPAADAVPLARLVAQAPERVALLVGAEGPGLTDEAMAAVDHRVRIPMAHGTDSVNVATAAAIALAALYDRAG